MGHVDHGKTTLLDYIRHTNVVSREAGGITQHIGAYQIEYKGKKLTFIDTPGHAAFAKMRERGARVTDIVVLVVAANDGVKPQTIESIRHIKNSNVAVVVAINKMDLKDVYPEVPKAQLAEQGILVNGFGGSIDAISISAKTGMGVDQLLDTLATMAELSEYKADPAAPLEAVVIESTKDARRGPVATVIVKQGTLKIRQDVTIEGAEHQTGRIKSLVDENGKQLVDVTPGSPAEIVGLTEVPPVGSTVHDMNAEYTAVASEEELDDAHSAFVPNFTSLFSAQPRLKLIIKADVQGTLEAITNTIDAESVELLSSGVGPVTDSEIELAKTSGAVIIAFHVKLPSAIKENAKAAGVKIKSYDVIYHLIEDLQKQMLKLLEPTIDEVITGEAEVVQVFEMKGERIAGCRVKTGEIKKHDRLHLKRGEEILFNPVIKNMMHGKQEVEVTKAKNECGMTFKNKKLDFQVGDMIVAYKLEDDE